MSFLSRVKKLFMTPRRSEVCVCISTQLWFRTGIRQQNPEGTHWEPIQVPREVVQVSAGPKDLLWVVLWDGQLLARTGICKDCPKGLTRTDLFLSFEFTHTVCTTDSTCFEWLTHRCYLWWNCDRGHGHVNSMTEVWTYRGPKEHVVTCATTKHFWMSLH